VKKAVTTYNLQMNHRDGLGVCIRAGMGFALHYLKFVYKGTPSIANDQPEGLDKNQDTIWTNNEI
jgi:hypothetical protein